MNRSTVWLLPIALLALALAVQGCGRVKSQDAMIAAGGLGEFAAGNRAVLIRGQQSGNEEVYRLRLDDLLTDADLSANAPVQPGDVIIVPESLL